MPLLPHCLASRENRGKKEGKRDGYDSSSQLDSHAKLAPKNAPEKAAKGCLRGAETDAIFYGQREKEKYINSRRGRIPKNASDTKNASGRDEELF